MEASAIEHVSDTAFWIAYHRGAETQRADALFRDPLATRLAGERGRRIADSMAGAGMTAWMTAIRTRIIDAYIHQALAQGTDTVLNLGAGLDTRPYRLDLPASLQWIEVDHPSVMAYKDAQLRNETPRCPLERVGLDLADPQARRGLFDGLGRRSRKTLVLTEGVLPYLSVGEVADLATDLRAQPAFSAWVVDYLSPLTAKYRKQRIKKMDLRNAPHKFNPPDWYAFFKNQGWTVAEKRFLAEEAKALHRPMPLPLGMRLRALVFGALARLRGNAWREFYGYFLLIPTP